MRVVAHRWRKFSRASGQFISSIQSMYRLDGNQTGPDRSIAAVCAYLSVSIEGYIAPAALNTQKSPHQQVAVGKHNHIDYLFAL